MWKTERSPQSEREQRGRHSSSPVIRAPCRLGRNALGIHVATKITQSGPEAQGSLIVVDLDGYYVRKRMVNRMEKSHENRDTCTFTIKPF